MPERVWGFSFYERTSVYLQLDNVDKSMKKDISHTEEVVYMPGHEKTDTQIERLLKKYSTE